MAVAASAQSLVHQWRFGENDGGAANGGAVTTVTDHVGSLTLTASGTVTYTGNTAGAGSSLAAAFDTTGSFVGAADESLTSEGSFIIEGWVRPDGTPSAGSKFLFYNGNASWSGIGLMVSGSTVQVLAGGAFDQNVGTLNADAWNYVALVYSNSDISIYINNTSAPSYSGGYFRDYSLATMNGQPNNFSVGGSFAGAIDELRVSTFTGSFSESMLSYSAMSAVPEPSTYAALAGLAALGLVAWRRRAVRV